MPQENFYSDHVEMTEKRIMKQRDKIVIGILLAIVGVILFSMICDCAEKNPWAESEVILEDSVRIEDPE